MDIIELIKALAELFKELAPFIALGASYFAYRKSRENKHNNQKHEVRTNALEKQQTEIQVKLDLIRGSYSILEDTNKTLQQNFLDSNTQNKELSGKLRDQEIAHQIDLGQYKDMANAAIKDREKAEAKRDTDRKELETRLNGIQHKYDTDTLQFRSLIDSLGDEQKQDQAKIKAQAEALQKANEWNSNLEEIITARDATIKQQRQEFEVTLKNFEDQVTRLEGYNKSLRESLWATSQAKTAQEWRMAALLERVDRLEHPGEQPTPVVHADVEEVLYASGRDGQRR